MYVQSQVSLSSLVKNALVTLVVIVHRERRAIMLLIAIDMITETIFKIE